MNRRILLAAIAAAGLVSFGAQAQPVQFHAALSGSTEVPPNKTEASGTATATLDRSTGTLTYEITYQGLSGPPTAMHFHGPAGAGQNSGVQVPIAAPLASPVKGTTGKLSDQQIQQLSAGQWYVNIHTKAYPGGELRGQLTSGGM
ncbi:MAG: CHRD domain-containing protein [Alphaproteobacteria bacterium]|nr:CHRD domain-containing protein [Alphaproteobacteria bacterium]